MSFNWDDYPVVEKGNVGSSSFNWNDYPVIEGATPSMPQNRDRSKYENNPFMSGVTGFNTKFGNVFHGILQPLLESGYLGERVSRSSKNVARERGEELERAKEFNPNATATGEFLGELGLIAPTIPLGGAGIARQALTGAGIGAARGASEYVNEGDDRLTNAAIESAIGAGAGAIPGLVKGAGTLYRATSPSRIAKKVVADRNALKSAYSKGYNEFFKEAEKEGINAIDVPKFNAKAIIKNTTKSEAEALKGFLKNPTLKNAHDAQSDLGKAIRRLERINESSGLKTSQSRALDAAKTAQERLRGAISGEFEKSGKSGLSKTYAELTEGYKREVLPYTRNKSINKFLKGDLTSQDLVRKLPKDEMFRARLLEKYPEIGIRGAASKYAPKIIEGSGIGLLAHYGIPGLARLFSED